MSHHRNRNWSASQAGAVPSASASVSISRRAWLTRAAGFAGAGVVAGILGDRLWAARASAPAPPPAADATLATVYANESCGCCRKWMAHLKDNVFKVDVHYVADVTPYKTQYGVTQDLWSCHTARIGGYTIEGHVPADLIRKLLGGAGTLAGLAVPGMPTGSPGMEEPTPQPYEVIAFGPGGKTSVFARR